MRRSLCFVLTLLSFAAAAQGRWQWLNPTPSGDVHRKILFADAANGYLLTSYRDVYRTGDGGRSWTLDKRFPAGTSLERKYGTMAMTAVTGEVYISTDDGDSWTFKSVEMDNAYWMKGVDIVSRDTLFAYSENPNAGFSNLYRSCDRGQSWQPVPPPPGGMQAYAVEFINGRVGFVGAWGKVYRTLDGGASWQVVNRSAYNSLLTCIQFYDTQRGYACRDSVMKTTDGGQTWTGTLVMPGEDIHSLFFVDSLHVFAAGSDGVAYRTVNGGASWEWIGASGLTDRTALLSQHFFDARKGLMVGVRGRILHTEDAGTTWAEHSPTYTDVTSLSFATDSIAYAAVWKGVFKTNDAGKTWTRLPVDPVDPNEFFRSVHFVSPDTGLVTDARLRVLRTTDGGQTWSRVSFPWYYDTFVGAFFTGGVGYLSVEGQGRSCILRSFDAGATWTEVHNRYPQSSQSFGRLHFVDAGTGYGTVYSQVYKTTDSARTWTKVHEVLPYPQRLTSVHFLNGKTGYVSGEGNYLARTVDSGRTWQELPIETETTGNDVLAVRFFDERVGFLSKGYASVLQTVDSGRSWQVSRHFSVQAIRHMAFTRSDSSVYIAGDYGALLKKAIKDFSIDSLQVDFLTACRGRATAKVSALWSTVDSIWIEWGSPGFEHRVVARPERVTDSTVALQQLMEGLAPGSSYLFRVRVLYNGQYHYSDVQPFRTASLPRPVITVVGTRLESSASVGNQWYRDGVAIAGATNRELTPTLPGQYTVQVAAQGCLSAMSDPYSHVVSALSDPVLEAALAVYPNPVSDELYVQNREGRRLQVRLYDGAGRLVRVLETASRLTAIDMRRLPAGIYRVLVREVRTGGVVLRAVVKG